MGNENTRGRVTIPTDVDVVPETLELLERWGADAIRDCDGTDYPAELRDVDRKSTRLNSSHSRLSRMPSSA